MMSSKEKINNIYCYLSFKEVEFKNLVTERQSLMIRKSDTYNLLEFYKAQVRYEVLKELSADIEKLIF